MESLSIQGGLMIWTVLTFACLFVLLARFAFKPLRRVLEEREATIRRSLDDAEAARRQAEAVLASNRAQLDQARDETRKIVQDGHRMVADMKREAQEKARLEAQRIVDEARAEIERDVRRGMDDLKSTVVNLSVRIARQVVHKHVDEQEHAALAKDLIERLKTSRKP
jgi:F-type H+-transporting ATPase subunit b